MHGNGIVRCVAPLDDGRLVSGSRDKTLIVWAAGDDGTLTAAQTLSGQHRCRVVRGAARRRAHRQRVPRQDAQSVE